MTLKECYDMFGGDYEDVSRRLPSEKLIEKFFLKFQDDKSYENLQNALKEGDYEEAFRAAHTLKGVAQNLSFKNLGQSSSSLTEALRAKKEKPGQELTLKNNGSEKATNVNVEATIPENAKCVQYIKSTEREETDTTLGAAKDYYKDRNA